MHDAGSHIFIQLMHVGRTSHPDNTPRHIQAVAPSAIAPKDQIFTLEGMKPIPEPRALTTEDIAGTVDDFRNAARHVVDAGADGARRDRTLKV